MKSELRIKALKPEEKHIKSFLRFNNELVNANIDVNIELITDNLLEIAFDLNDKANSKRNVPNFRKARIYDSFSNRVENEIFVSDRMYPFVQAFGITADDILECLQRPQWDSDKDYIYYTTKLKPVSDFLLNARGTGREKLFQIVVIEEKPVRLTEWEQLELREPILLVLQERFENIRDLLSAEKNEILAVKGIGMATYQAIEFWKENEKYFKK